MYLNYRTTDEMRKYAVNLLEGRAIDDLDGELDENKRYKSLSHGPEPIIENVHNLEQTGETIQKILNLWNQEGTENSAYNKNCPMNINALCLKLALGIPASQMC